jgi:hypothetical protein
MAKKLIFLDFDGVLHPYPKSMAITKGLTSAMVAIPHWQEKYNKRWSWFMCLPYFCVVLRRFDNWEIVLSTSWREPSEEIDPKTGETYLNYHMTLDDLKDMFPKDIAANIIGGTPVHRNNMRKGARHAEILDWLKINDRESDEWVALDDLDNLFEDNCQQLLHCNDELGFAPGTKAALGLMEFLSDK